MSKMEFGYIYKITCKPTGKVYIGQARENKHKNGKPYRYGIQGRWNDHVSSSKTSIGVFAEAIRQYGKEAFDVEEIEKAPLESLDALEAKWIESYNSVIPNGYNRVRHSQNKHRESSNIYEFFQGKALYARLSKIHKNTKVALVYVNVSLNDGTQRRVVFGNNTNTTFEDAYTDARKFCENLGCEWKEDTTHSTNPLERYASKIEELKGKEIKKIRIASASSLIGVYILTNEATSYKDQIRVCFGGKTIPKQEAYKLAILFVDQLQKNNQTIIEDAYQSSQQVAASMGETSP